MFSIRFCLTLITLCLLVFGNLRQAKANIIYPEGDLVVEFATNKLQNTVAQKPLPLGVEEILLQRVAGMQEQSFSIKVNKKQIIIRASDSNGLMYGALELNEQILFGHDISTIDIQQRPYLKKRGLKFNVPLDARNPSYDDTGSSAQNNIATVWDMDFWVAYLDRMAEHRYNQLTLWNPQPFTSMLKLNAYPGLALEDVYISEAPLNKKVGVWGEAGGVSKLVTARMRKVKTLSIEEKIAFWRNVMNHAKNRGIDIHLITWAIYTNGINNYGINERINNPKTLAFFREAVKELVLTYPDLKGIGITAGERMAADGEVENWTREKWLYETYGLGLADAKAINPKRNIDFIHRFWYSGYEEIQKYWGNYPDHFSFSFKYLMARMYSSPAPSHLAKRVVPLIRNNNKTAENRQIKTWWNLRNDDTFVYRWGDPEYASTFYKNLPMDVTEGTHMGSDGYVWAKTFSDKQIDISNYWEIDKHWYRFMLWGRLAYNPELGQSFFEKQLAHKFPEADATLLYKTWRAASQIIPAVNRYQFQPGDRKFAPESSSSRETFRYVNDFQVARSMPESGQLNARAYVKMLLSNKDMSGQTSPLALADFMAEQSKVALEGAQVLNSGVVPVGLELSRTLDDIRASAYLGLYYAEKIRSAVALELFEKNGQQREDKIDALAAIDKAIKHWADYRLISEQNYYSQMLARVNYLDWSALEKEVQYERKIVEAKVNKPFEVPSTNDPNNQLKLQYQSGLSGENRHKRMEVYTPDGGDFMVEVYESDGVFINNYHSKGQGAMRWEWFQERQKGTYYLNLKWRDKNRVIKVEL